MSFFSTRNVVGAATAKNVLPDWWVYGFIGFEVLVMSGLAYQSLASPVQAFRGVLPRGWDTETDEVKDSSRVKIQGAGAGQGYLMVLALICGPLLFAKNSLHGQPLLQQQLTTIVVGATLFSDIALWLLTAIKTPSKLFWSFSQWGDGQKGIFLYVPVGSLLKLVWLFGVGRDVV